MKKLISILLMLMLLAYNVCALAEDVPTPTPVPSPDVETSAKEATGSTTEYITVQVPAYTEKDYGKTLGLDKDGNLVWVGDDNVVASEAQDGDVSMGSLLGDGLIVTAGGLCGVFLVLVLFFFTIKGIQKFIK